MTDERIAQKKLASVTRFLYITITICALVWVSISYLIAIYSTVKLGVVYTMSELSEPAITAILGIVLAKTFGNIFEHNDGVIFGKSVKENTNDSEVI